MFTKKIPDSTLTWLLEGDVSIQYQVYRDLLSGNREELRGRIAHEGWGARFLSLRNEDGHWGREYYQPKWTSTHYTLLDLKNLGISPGIRAIRETVDLVLETVKGKDGGVGVPKTIEHTDVCVNGMFLNCASYFGAAEDKLRSIVDLLLSQRMADGGFNCRSNRSGARHSSLHTTLSVAEGILEYRLNGYTYRLEELEAAERSSQEFMLLHRLFLSDRTGEIIHKDFLRFPYPSRWKYDILRALDYFRYAGVPFDERMQPALDVVFSKKGVDGRWKLPAHYPGKRHFDMEKAGEESRWNTLRGLRVLDHFCQT